PKSMRRLPREVVEQTRQQMRIFGPKAYGVAGHSGDRALLDSVAWRRLQSFPPLLPDEIHVWRSHLVVDASSQLLLRSYLSEEENERAARFKFDRDRDRFITARGTLRILLARYLRKRPKDLQLLLGPEGKPTLAPDAAGETLNFNLS